ncbi:MAG: hypothetical protein ACRBFS_21315 [Aureispira sp.]
MSASKFNNRLKAFLLDIIIREKDTNAWAYLKTLKLDCDDLSKIITRPPFVKEAWELFKNKNGTKEHLIPIIKQAEDAKVKMEVEAILIENFTLVNKELEIIIKANQSDVAAKLLLKKNPSNEELETIMRYSKLSDQAAQELLSRSPNKDELYEIIEYSNFKKEAWKLFVEQLPTKEEIINIIHFTDLEEIAWEFLLAQSPSNEELKDFVHDFSETGRKQKEAAALILSQEPNVEDLVDLLQNDLYPIKAWEALKKKKLQEEDMIYIAWRLIRQEPSKKNEAAKLCLNFDPSETVLWDILQDTIYKEEAAELLILKTRLELYELEKIIVESAIAPVVKELSERVHFDRSQVNEIELIQEIGTKILANPELLDVNNWHNQERHSLGGWAITLNKQAQGIEKKYSSEIAACLLLPSYRHLIFADRETVLRELKTIPSIGLE